MPAPFAQPATLRPRQAATRAGEAGRERVQFPDGRLTPGVSDAAALLARRSGADGRCIASSPNAVRTPGKPTTLVAAPKTAGAPRQVSGDPLRRADAQIVAEVERAAADGKGRRNGNNVDRAPRVDIVEAGNPNGPMSELEPVPPRPTREPFSAALRAAFRENGEVAAVRDAVCSYVDAARAGGEPVERVIIDLKQEMRGAGVVDRYLRPEERVLAESVIRWCIERYYGSASRANKSAGTGL